MSNVQEMRIFAAEQIDVPDEFPGILKNFIKEVVRAQPEEVTTFARQYFEELLKQKQEFGNRPQDREHITLNPKEFYLKHKTNIQDHFELHEVIGEGALSRVRRATHKHSKMIRAVKIVRKEDLEFGERRKLLEEIELLKELDHPNIGQVIEMYEDQKKIYFVNEMMQGGSLLERLTRETVISEEVTARIIRQVLSSLTYLHSQGIVHGDIKPSNIHFHTVEDDIVKMIDFGSSRRVAQDELLHGVYGTSYYVAPETLEGGYDHSADVWAVGVLLYILLSGEPPFDGACGRDIIAKVKQGQFKMSGGAWDAISNEAKDLISNMLVTPEKRISAAQAFQHPWFERAMKPQQQDKAKAEIMHRALENFRKFNGKNKAKQAALGYLVQHFMNVSDVIQLEQVFQDLDTSGDGTLSVNELLEGYKRFYGSDFNVKEVEALIQMADSGGDGVINYSEFMLTAVNREKFLTIERLEALFNEMDIDGNNAVSLEELKYFLGQSENMDTQALEAAFESVDPEGVGEISFDQFKNLINDLLE